MDEVDIGEANMDESGMDEAGVAMPERLYATPFDDSTEGHWWNSRGMDGETEYVRSDVVEAEKKIEFFKGAIDIYAVITGLIKAGTPIEGILQLTEQSEKTLRKYTDG